MERGRKKNIIYFYLRKKIQEIGKAILHTGPDKPEYLKKGVIYFLKKAGIALVVFICIYQVFFYLNLGRLLTWEEFKQIQFLKYELLFGYIFTLSVFLIFPQIAPLLNRTKFSSSNNLTKVIIEILVVIICSSILLSFLNYLPLFLLFPEIDPPAANLRAGYLVTAIFALFFYFLVEREKGRKKLEEELLLSAKLQKVNLQAQLETLKRQVNPHFLFNSLNVLGSLILQDKERAVQFSRKLAELYRSFLKHGEYQLISLQKELKVTTSYIYLLETRFGQAININTTIDPSTMQLQIPPGALQMLIENSIKHNGSTRKKPLNIEIYTKANRLLVTNNLQPRIEKIESTGTGLNNIKNRYKYLSDREVQIEKTETHFTASLPLLKVENHESSIN